jgi:hypothetical protein
VLLVEYMGEIRNADTSLVRSLNRREYMKDFNFDWSIILKCVLKVDWIYFAQKRNKYWMLGIIILNL